MTYVIKRLIIVSTHSRPKAAGGAINERESTHTSFNTQPPEGGWNGRFYGRLYAICFNTQPPEGGWFVVFSGQPLLAGFNTQPPEGGWGLVRGKEYRKNIVSTHSRPKAAGFLKGVWV